MKFCEDHWQRLRQAIDDRALSGLIAKDGATAVRQLEQQITERQEKPTRETFDPLMDAHWNILSNAMRLIEQAGGQPLYLLASGPEDPVDGRPGRTWSRCPVCYVNLVHELSCREDGCRLDRVRGYDWMLERAAEDALKQARELGLAPPAS